METLSKTLKELYTRAHSFEKDYLGEWNPSSKEEYLYNIAHQYHIETEQYDRTVCTGPIGKGGGVLPSSGLELAKINGHARDLLITLQDKAWREFGIPKADVVGAISRYRTAP